MPLNSDIVLGDCYLDPNAFLERAEVFGAGVSLPSDPLVIKGYLAAASRWVEAKCHKKFIPDEEYTEQHGWDPVTRRIYPGNPPVLSISSYKIYTGPQTFSTMPTNTIFINNSENWVELSALSAAGNLTSALLTVGLYEPIVEITYTSTNDVKPNIAQAVGYIAAAMMNQSYLTKSLPTGIKSIKIGSQAQVTLGDNTAQQTAFGDLAVQRMVETLLAGEMNIGIA